MTTYITLLRGINVNGKNLIKMVELKSLFEKMGFLKIKTYLQSGNIIFDFSLTKISELVQKISQEIEKEFNLKIPIIVIKRENFIEISKNNSFLNKNNLTQIFFT